MVIGFSSSACAAATSMPSHTDIEKLIETSNVLGGKYRATVTLNGTQAIVTAMLNRDAKNKVNDAKINAILVAKTIMKAYDAVGSVKCNFVDESSPNRVFSALVTVGDIIAFTEGKVSMDRLLDSIVVDQYANRSAPPVQRQNAPAEGSPVETINAGATSVTMSVFRDDASGISFHYPQVSNPQDGTLKRNPDAETIVDINGSAPNMGPYSISLRNLHEVPSGTTPAQFMQVFETFQFPKMTNAKIVGRRQIAFGNRLQYRGVTDRLSVANASETFDQHWVVFDDNGHLRCIVLTWPLDKSRSFEPVLHHILLSMETTHLVGHQPGIAVAGDRSQPVSRMGEAPVQERLYDGERVQFYIPTDAKIAENPDQGTLVRVNCQTQEAAAEFGVKYGFPTDATPEQILGEMQDPPSHNANFKSISQGPQQAGADRSLSGIRKCFSFNEKNGTTIIAQLYAFHKSNNLYCAFMYTAGFPLPAANSRFDRVLSTLKFK
jgi:hypothetical protein